MYRTIGKYQYEKIETRQRWSKRMNWNYIYGIETYVRSEWPLCWRIVWSDPLDTSWHYQGRWTSQEMGQSWWSQISEEITHVRGIHRSSRKSQIFGEITDLCENHRYLRKSLSASMSSYRHRQTMLWLPSTKTLVEVLPTPWTIGGARIASRKVRLLDDWSRTWPEKWWILSGWRCCLNENRVLMMILSGWRFWPQSFPFLRTDGRLRQQGHQERTERRNLDVSTLGQHFSGWICQLDVGEYYYALVTPTHTFWPLRRWSPLGVLFWEHLGSVKKKNTKNAKQKYSKYATGHGVLFWKHISYKIQEFNVIFWNRVEILFALCDIQKIQMDIY